MMVLFIVSISYIYFYMLQSSENIKVDKVLKNARYIEKTVQERLNELIKKQEKTANFIFKYEKILRESRLGYVGLNNIYLFFIIAVVLGYISFNFSRGLLNQYPAAIIIMILVSKLPFDLLKVEVDRTRRSIRRHLPHFLLTILQMLEATEDIIEVLEATKDKFKDPLKKHITEFLRNYRSGMELDQAILILKSRFDNPIILQFFDDMKSNIENGTRLKGAIEEYIIKSYNNEINYLERITENSGSITGAGMVVIIFVYAVYTIKNLKPDFMDILTHNTIGQLAVDAIILLMVFAIYLMRLSVSYKDSK